MRPCSTSRTGTREACYFHDPAGNIVELIAHHGVGEAGNTGTFGAGELLGVSEVGLVCDPPSLAEALERELGLEVWDGTVEGEGRLAFVGEKARTLILCRRRAAVAADGPRRPRRTRSRSCWRADPRERCRWTQAAGCARRRTSTRSLRL